MIYCVSILNEFCWNSRNPLCHFSSESTGHLITDNFPMVCDRLCKNDNNSDWGNKTIHLHTLSEYPFKLSSNNQRSSTNHRSDYCQYVVKFLRELFWTLFLNILTKTVFSVKINLVFLHFWLMWKPIIVNPSWYLC